MTVAFLTVISFAVNAQTNVSGGIFSNTTWTLANSPYIVTDTVVVFPNVTLTIEPGVTVKFADTQLLEIRQAKLIAAGTAADSITFTSNSLSPAPGIYSGIYLNGGTLTSTFNYCNFIYAVFGIKITVSDSVIVNNSNFNFDSTGLQFIGIGIGSAQAAVIDNSIFMNNANTGMNLQGLSSSKINYCNFINNSYAGLILKDLQSGAMSLTMNHCNFSYNGAGLKWFLHSSVINNCHFSNNTSGIQVTDYLSHLDTYNNTAKNSVFDYNQTGFDGIGFTLIDSCTVIHNQTGINSGVTNRIKNSTIDSNSVTGINVLNDSVINCNIKYNGVGIHIPGASVIIGNSIEYNTAANISGASVSTTIKGNTIRYSNVGIDNITGNFLITENIIDNNNVGINLNSSNGTLSCNRICNNTTYDLSYGAVSNFNASNNYWCTPDSASTAAVIYDGYDNVSYGLVSFLPADSTCYLNTGISINEIRQFSAAVFPNPFNEQLNIKIQSNEVSEFTLYDIAAKKLLQQKFTNSVSLNTGQIEKGIYIYEVRNKNGTSAKGKVIKL